MAAVNEKKDDFITKSIIHPAENTRNLDNKELRKIAKPLTKKATFVLPLELHKRLKTAAVEKDMTMLEIVEKALENYLRK